MTRVQLARLIQWAGTFRSRKRMQKVCFLLQAAGCPLELEFYLDSIGPYSEDLAHLTNDMTIVGLLEEEAEGPQFHQRFNYRLSVKAEQQLADMDSSCPGKTWEELTPYEWLFRQLIEEDVQNLQNAASLVYLLRRGREKSQIVDQLCARKRWAKCPEIVLNLVDLIMARSGQALFDTLEG